VETASDQAPAVAQSVATRAARAIRLARIAARARAGETCASIARDEGISAQRVWKILKDTDIELGRPGRRPGSSPATLEEARVRRAAASRRVEVGQAYADGISRAELARRHGVSERTIGNDLRVLGVDARPPGRPSRYAPAVARTCPVCGVVWMPRFPSWARRRADTCTRACASEYRAEHPAANERECGHEGCAKRFTPSRFETARGHGRFCSRRCWALERWIHRYENEANLTPLVRAGWPGRARQRFVGKISGHLGGRKPQRELDPAYAEKASEARELRRKNPRLGTPEIAKRTGLSRWQVRAILDAPSAS
jgi:transposase-like protein